MPKRCSSSYSVLVILVFFPCIKQFSTVSTRETRLLMGGMAPATIDQCQNDPLSFITSPRWSPKNNTKNFSPSAFWPFGWMFSLCAKKHSAKALALFLFLSVASQCFCYKSAKKCFPHISASLCGKLFQLTSKRGGEWSSEVKTVFTWRKAENPSVTPLLLSL